MRLTKKHIEQLLSEKDKAGLLKCYSGYLQKYKHLLMGRLPDLTKDTRLFVEAIADLDIVALLGVYDTITDDLDEKLEELLMCAMKDTKDAEVLNARFRNGLAKWLHRLLGESY